MFTFMFLSASFINSRLVCFRSQRSNLDFYNLKDGYLNNIIKINTETHKKPDTRCAKTMKKI